MNPINISTHPALLAWQPAAWLRVSGEDAATFLQGQFTNDLRALEASAPAVYGLWLTLKGKVQADGFVLRADGDSGVDAGAQAGGFWVGSYFSPAAVIRERLESFVIADDVMIEDATADWVGLSVIGDGARERVVAAAREVGGCVFPGRRVRRENVEWVMRRSELATARARLGEVVEIDAATAEAWRIADGIPSVPVDLGLADLPNEGAIETEAISYTKGCYLGQEVMARLKAMGQVRRRLVRVRVSGTAEHPVERTALVSGERQVGELRSVARDPNGEGWIALAMVSLLHVRAETRLALGTDGAAAVTLLDAP